MKKIITLIACLNIGASSIARGAGFEIIGGDRFLVGRDRSDQEIRWWKRNHHRDWQRADGMYLMGMPGTFDAKEEGFDRLGDNIMRFMFEDLIGILHGNNKPSRNNRKVNTSVSPEVVEDLIPIQLDQVVEITQPVAAPTQETFHIIQHIEGIGHDREPYDLKLEFTHTSDCDYDLTISVEGARVSRLLDKFWIPVDSHGFPVSVTFKEGQITKIMTFRIEWKDSTFTVFDLSTSPKNLMEAP